MIYEQIASLYKALKRLSEINTVCSLTIARNMNKCQEKVQEIEEGLRSLLEDYCTPIDGGGYKLLDGVEDKGGKNTYFEFDAGDKQKEYIGKLVDVFKNEHEIELKKISLAKKCIDSSGEETTLEGLLESNEKISADIIAPLLENVFE
jgi:hypothetical protein